MLRFRDATKEKIKLGLSVENEDQESRTPVKYRHTVWKGLKRVPACGGWITTVKPVQGIIQRHTFISVWGRTTKVSWRL